MTPDDWLEENDLTIEDVLNKLKGISQTYRFEQDNKISTPLKVEYTDESREIIVAPRWRTTELFPMNDINQNWFINTSLFSILIQMFGLRKTVLQLKM